MILVWESNASRRQKSAKLEGGNLNFEVGNHRFSAPCMKHWIHKVISTTINLCSGRVSVDSTLTTSKHAKGSESVAMEFSVAPVHMK